MGVCEEWVCEGRQTEEAEDRWGRQVSERGTERDRQTDRGRGGNIEVGEWERERGSEGAQQA